MAQTNISETVRALIFAITDMDITTVILLCQKHEIIGSVDSNQLISEMEYLFSKNKEAGLFKFTFKGGVSLDTEECPHCCIFFSKEFYFAIRISDIGNNQISVESIAKPVSYPPISSKAINCLVGMAYVS